MSMVERNGLWVVLWRRAYRQGMLAQQGFKDQGPRTKEACPEVWDPKMLCHCNVIWETKYTGWGCIVHRLSTLEIEASKRRAIFPVAQAAGRLKIRLTWSLFPPAGHAQILRGGGDGTISRKRVWTAIRSERTLEPWSNFCQLPLTLNL